MSEFAIGTTLVAIGTSMPELATVLIARFRGHDEVGLGTILGSNNFNALFIVGTAAAITPYAIAFSEVAPALLVGFAAVIMTYPPRTETIDCWRGGLLLALYGAYVLAVLRV